MIRQKCRNTLESAIPELRSIPPGGSILAGCSGEILTMIDAYYRDGMTFLSQGDEPNVLASFAYALGWLDAGAALGLVGPGPCGVPVDVEAGPPGESGDIRLEKKTTKYRSLLDTALDDLLPAAETGTCLNAAGERFLVVARIFLDQGRRREERGDFTSALAFYSYGFAWLDAGIRTGIFRIVGHPEIFTV